MSNADERYLKLAEEWLDARREEEVADRVKGDAEYKHAQARKKLAAKTEALKEAVGRGAPRKAILVGGQVVLISRQTDNHTTIELLEPLVPS